MADDPFNPYAVPQSEAPEKVAGWAGGAISFPYTAQQLRVPFYVCMACYTAMFFLSIPIAFAAAHMPDLFQHTPEEMRAYQASLEPYSSINTPISIIGVIAWFVMVYRLWNMIQPLTARCTPGKAVGFMFIPLFNLYWYFVAVVGLAQDLNKSREQLGPGGPTANEELALAQFVCFFGFAALSLFRIPLLTIGLSASGLVLSIMVYKSLIHCAVGMITSSNNKT